MVISATAKDLPDLAIIGAQFFKEGVIPGDFVPHVWIRSWANLLASGHGHILKKMVDGNPVGAIGFILSNDLNDGKLVANEAFWFILPESRGRGFELLMRYEEKTKSLGCHRCSMIHLESLQPERLANIYSKRGYKKIETSYFKQLI